MERDLVVVWVVLLGSVLTINLLAAWLITGRRYKALRTAAGVCAVTTSVAIASGDPF